MIIIIIIINNNNEVVEDKYKPIIIDLLSFKDEERRNQLHSSQVICIII